MRGKPVQRADASDVVARAAGEVPSGPLRMRVRDEKACGRACAVKIRDLGLRAGGRRAAVGVETAELVALAEAARAAIVAAAHDHQIARAGQIPARERGLRGESVTPLA